MRKLRIAPLLLLVFLLSCGDGKSMPPQTVSVAGNWQFSLQSNPSKAPSGFLLQKGTSINGGFLTSGNCSGDGPVQGQIDGANVSLELTAADQTLSLSGTATADGSQMSGTYSSLASGCGGTETGTWTAFQVQPVTGSFQATFTSVISGFVFYFSGTLTQGSNTGASYATLKGNMTSTDAYCFTTASISGQISGTAAVFNLSDSNGNALGKITADVSSSAATALGGYAFVNTQVPLQCGSDYGTVVFTIQPPASSGT